MHAALDLERHDVPVLAEGMQAEELDARLDAQAVLQASITRLDGAVTGIDVLLTSPTARELPPALRAALLRDESALRAMKRLHENELYMRPGTPDIAALDLLHATFDAPHVPSTPDA